MKYLKKWEALSFKALLFVRQYKAHILLCVTILLTALGVKAFHEYAILNSKDFSFWDCLYRAFELFKLKGGDPDGRVPLSLKLARFLAPLATASGVGLVFFEYLYRNYMEIVVGTYKNHIIICGLSKKAESLIDNLITKENGKTNPFKNWRADIILIESNKEHENLARFEAMGVKIIIGSATETEVLKKANVLKAKSIIALTDKDETNVEISKTLTQIFKRYYEKHKVVDEKQLKSVIHLEDFFLLQAFKDYHEIKIPAAENSNSAIDFHAINVYQKAAQKILDDHAPDRLKEVKPGGQAVEILIMGLTVAGENILIEAAYIYHFLNCKKLKIHVVDIDIKKKVEQLVHFIPAIEEVVDILPIEQTDFLQNYKEEDLANISVCFVAKETDGESVYYSKALKQIFF